MTLAHIFFLFHRSDWGACSATCGMGIMERDRGIAVATRGSGKLCEPHDRSEVKGCKLQECGVECIDGKWGEWGDFSECSASCGGGYQYSFRKVLVTPSSCPECGKALSGPDRKYQSCNTHACDETVIDCAFGDWTSWGDCSCPCNGVQDRSRRITTYNNVGGQPCGGATKEIRGCNVHSSACNGIPVDCVMGEWGDFGSCSSECGGGVMRRSRYSGPHYRRMDCTEEFLQR